MKISALNQNYTQKKYASNSTASFRGKYDIANDITNQIAKESKGFVGLLTKIGNTNLESMSTIVTAIGTAFVAPIFIAFNPISKEDKDTKIYSAMRQPISAVIALAMQLSVNKKFNNYLDKLASTGQLDRADLRSNPQNSYIKKILKGQKLSKEELNNAVQEYNKNAFRNTVEKARIDMKNTDIKYEDLVDTATFKKAKDQLFAEKAKELEGKSKKAQAKLVDKDTIMDRATEIIKKDMDTEAKVKLSTSRMKKSGISIEKAIEKVTSELQGINKELETIQDAAAKTVKEQEKTLKEAVLNKLKKNTSMEQLKIHGSSFEEVLQSVKIKQFVEAQGDIAGSVFKSIKKWGGIGLALTTLPFSCGLLNWAYPRIMEKFMPEVANAKKAKGGK